MNTQSRWRSKVLWSAIIAQVLSLLQMTGLLAKIGLDLGTVGDVTAALLELAVILGIINNPTNSKDW